MQRIEQLKLELSKAIKESPEYILNHTAQTDLRQQISVDHILSSHICISIIDKDPNLKRSIDEFRRQNFDIQNSGKVDDIFAAQEDLNNRYADMRRQDMVNRYLLSEVCLCRMVQDICRTVVETIEFDVDFLNN